MSRCILSTVGTSLLTNRDDRPWAGWRPGDDFPDAAQVDAWLTAADASAASAETNTLKRLELSEADVLVLLHSDTPEGRFCAERLQTLYGGTVREVGLEKIGKLGYGADHFTAGLKALVDVTLRKVHEARAHGTTPLFCATGGFKAEIAFLNLTGALLGIEVVYIHELHRELVRLPRLPLAWDADFVVRHEDFFRWIDEEPRKSTDVESWLKSRPDLRPLVEGGDDGCTYLSAAGDLLYRVAKEQRSMGPRAVWPQADPRPPQEKNGLSGVEHHRPSGWERFVERLCAVDCVTSVRYDPKARGGARVTVIDGENGILGVCYGEQGNTLPLRVETTARSQAQTDLVAGYFRQMK